MGNFSSIDKSEQKKCGICDLVIETGCVYLDIVCSKCKERCKGYYHSDCLHNYNIENIKRNCFICPKCNFQYNDTFIA